MANDITNAETYQDFIDEELVASSKSGFLTPNEDQVEYDGGDTVKIAEIDVSGLGDYDTQDTDNAYPKGSVTTRWRDYTFAQDRAVEFRIDRLDPADSRYIATAENIIRTFARTKLVPEQDTYRFNRIYAALAAETALVGTHVKALASLNATNILQEISGMLQIIEDDSEAAADMVCVMSSTLKQYFPETTSTNRYQVRFGVTVSINGVTYTDVTMLGDLPILFAPAKRLQTVIQINDGRTTGQTAGGIVADATSKQIHALIMGTEAAAAVGKVDSLKEFGPEVNQKFDGTMIQARYVYDCWSFKRQLPSIGALIAQ
jgi:hypothetical protein